MAVDRNDVLTVYSGWYVGVPVINWRICREEAIFFNSHNKSFHLLLLVFSLTLRFHGIENVEESPKGEP